MEDLPTLVELARAMHVHSAYSVVPFEQVMCEVSLEMLIAEDQYCFFVAEKDEQIIGALPGMLVPMFPFSRALKLADVAVYVSPEHRGSRAGLMLINAYENWGKEKGAVFCYLGVTTGYNKAGDFYKKIGYTEVGGFYCKDLRITS